VTSVEKEKGGADGWVRLAEELERAGWKVFYRTGRSVGLHRPGKNGTDVCRTTVFVDIDGAVWVFASRGGATDGGEDEIECDMKVVNGLCSRTLRVTRRENVPLGWWKPDAASVERLAREAEAAVRKLPRLVTGK
jgi:hypothetical protein